MRLKVAAYGSVAIFAMGTFVVSQFWDSQRDLGLNLFAESIGVAFTLLIIEKLLRLEENRRGRPARYAAYRDAQLIYGRFCSLWFDIIRTTIDPERDAALLKIDGIELLDVRFGAIVQRLNLDGNAPVIPKRNWRALLQHQAQDIERRIDTCLQRYAVFMDPKLITTLQDLERTSFIQLAKLTSALVQADRELGVKRSPYFGWGGPGTADELIVPLRNLGRLLEKIRPEFTAMPDVPVTIDTKHQSMVNALRQKVASLGEESDA